MIYNANGATSGSVPANQTKTLGVDLILATNSGNLARTGYTFTGWNTPANGLGTHYAAGGACQCGCHTLCRVDCSYLQVTEKSALAAQRLDRIAAQQQRMVVARSRRASANNRLRVKAMNSAAGIPLSDTLEGN